MSTVRPIIDKEKQSKDFDKIIELRNMLNKNLHGTKSIRKWRDSKG